MCYVKVTNLTGIKRTFAGEQNQYVEQIMQLQARMKAMDDFLGWLLGDLLPLVLVMIVNVTLIAAGSLGWMGYGYIVGSIVLLFFYYRTKRTFAGVLYQMFEHFMLHRSPWMDFLHWLIGDLFPLVLIMNENVQLIIRSAAGSLGWMEYGSIVGFIVSLSYSHRKERTFAGVLNQPFPDVMFHRSSPWMDFLFWFLELFSLAVITIAGVLLMIDSAAIIESLGWMEYVYYVPPQTQTTFCDANGNWNVDPIHNASNDAI